MCCFLNVLLFIHLKMFKIGCRLNVIHCNNSCIACYSVWHRTTTVHLVIFMWITSCKFSWYLHDLQHSDVGLLLCVMLNMNILSQMTLKLKVKFPVKEEQHCLLPSRVDGFTCVHSENALLIHTLSIWFSSTSILFSCTPFGIYIYIIFIYGCGC